MSFFLDNSNLLENDCQIYSKTIKKRFRHNKYKFNFVDNKIVNSKQKLIKNERILIKLYNNYFFYSEKVTFLKLYFKYT